VNDSKNSTTENNIIESITKEKPTNYSNSKQKNKRKFPTSTFIDEKQIDSMSTNTNKNLSKPMNIVDKKIAEPHSNKNKKITEPYIIKNKKQTKSSKNIIITSNNKKLKPKKESQSLSSSLYSSDNSYSSTSSHISSSYTSYDQSCNSLSSSSLISVHQQRQHHQSLKSKIKNNYNKNSYDYVQNRNQISKQKHLSDSSIIVYDDYDSISYSTLLSSRSSSISKSHIPRRKNSSLPPSLYNSFSSSTNSTTASPNLSSQSLSLCSTCFDDNTIHKNHHITPTSSSFSSTYSTTMSDSHSSTHILEEDFSESFYSSYLSSSFVHPR